jgi:hypothetical protein
VSEPEVINLEPEVIDLKSKVIGLESTPILGAVKAGRGLRASLKQNDKAGREYVVDYYSKLKQPYHLVYTTTLSSINPFINPVPQFHCKTLYSLCARKKASVLLSHSTIPQLNEYNIIPTEGSLV